MVPCPRAFRTVKNLVEYGRAELTVTQRGKLLTPLLDNDDGAQDDEKNLFLGCRVVSV